MSILNYELVFESSRWQAFHENLLKDKQGLDRLVNVVGSLGDEVQDCSFLFHSAGGNPSNLDIMEKTMEFFRHRLLPYHKRPVAERNEIYKGMQKKLHTALKASYEDNAFSLGPEQVEIASEYIDSLKP